MINFIRPINYNGQLFEFSFARILTIQGPKYFVMVTDSNREYYFIMERNKDEWIINDAPKVPEWIHEMREQLTSVVINNEAETN